MGRFNLTTLALTGTLLATGCAPMPVEEQRRAEERMLGLGLFGLGQSQNDPPTTDVGRYLMNRDVANEGSHSDPVYLSPPQEEQGIRYLSPHQKKKEFRILDGVPTSRKLTDDEIYNNYKYSFEQDREFDIGIIFKRYGGRENFPEWVLQREPEFWRQYFPERFVEEKKDN